MRLCLHIPHTVLPPEARRLLILTFVSFFAQDIPSIPTSGSQERAIWRNSAGWYVHSRHPQIKKLTSFQEEHWDIYYQWANHHSLISQHSPPQRLAASQLPPFRLLLLQRQ
jgi:hypothetical protein